MSVSADEITTLPVTLKHCLCASRPEHERRTSGRSDTSPHCRFMVVYVSGNSQEDRERQPDSLAKRPRFEPDLFLFFFHLPFSFPLSCHMVKVEPSGGNDEQTTQGGWGRERAGWMDGGRDRGGGDTKESLSHSLRCWNIKVSSQVVIFLRKPREEGDKWSERRREAGGPSDRDAERGKGITADLSFLSSWKRHGHTFNTATLISLALYGLSLPAPLLRKMWIIQQEWCTAALKRQQAHWSAMYLWEKQGEWERPEKRVLRSHTADCACHQPHYFQFQSNRSRF